MKRNYCTLFNYNYLSRGLVLYNSLKKTHKEFTLYIFTLDEKTRAYLQNMNPDNCVIVGHNEFEDQDLLKVKSERTFAEYCWTCTSSVIRYAITKYNLDSCTYLDADLYFYASPEIIFNELEQSSVGLTPHNYSKEYDKENVAGKYCVQFVYFRNNENGMMALEWWRERCIEWCYARMEKGRFGDQKYLDYFDQFKGITDINNEGSGIAPWNILRFDFYRNNENILYGKDKHGKHFPVIFYHFHKIKIDYDEKTAFLDKYYYKPAVIDLVYKPYLEELISWDNLISGKNYSLNDFRIKSPGKGGLVTGQVLRKLGNIVLLRRLYNLLRGF